MASCRRLLSEEQFKCSICRYVFTDPVTTPCGHNFCNACITTCWDSRDRCQCPLCRKTFENSPDLSVNTFISELAGKAKVREMQHIIQDQKKLLDKHMLWRIQEDAVDVNLHSDTACPYLILSEYGKQVRLGNTQKNLPDVPERFDKSLCVLGKQSFSSGRFYYEVQVEGKTKWDLGVARESINRKGRVSLRPGNGYWTMRLRNGHEYQANAFPPVPPVPLSLRQKPQNVGVFVDYEEGQVSFYDVEARSHIYSFTGCSFTEKLYPFFSPGLNDDGKNSAPLIITPVNLIYL